VLLDRKEFVKTIGDIAATGREFNIHLTLICQNPTSGQLGDASIKRNMPTRLVGRVDSPEAAHVATGQPRSGAEFLTGAGDLLFIRPGSVKRLTAGLLTDKDIAGLPRGDGTRRLDLGEYEDVDHVLAQADNESKVGRPQDPLEASHVALALSDQNTSQRAKPAILHWL
jgi:DNA segregation ATPase FtsK/SpoIIIE-like protein